VVIEITEALTKFGHKSVIACDGGVLSAAAMRAGAEIVTLPLASKSPFTMRRNAARLVKLIREQKIDLIHAHSRAPAWSALWAAKRAGVPLVTTYHGTYNENAPFKRRYNAVMAAGDRVIAVSEFIGGLVRERHKVGEDRLRIIPGGVDAQKFDPALVQGDRVARMAREWRLEVDEPVIMLPGRLTSWKGQRVLIQALAEMRNKHAIAVMVGSDQGRESYAQSLIGLAESLGVADRLRLVGHTEDMPAAMMLADIVVNASTDPEGFGRTVVEAQAMGRVVVATSHGGAGETVIDGKTGFLVPPGEPKALAAALDQALAMSADERVAWGRHTRELVGETYSVRAMQYAVMGVYGELLD
jgi:glycosyltransferase involved in cell wall biosynthesis